uniref:Uncharacterized protein n=1 Tax=Canis lupus familiaris TaxID=9615 RepID=A0A8C0T8N3_CANLF
MEGRPWPAGAAQPGDGGLRCSRAARTRSRAPRWMPARAPIRGGRRCSPAWGDCAEPMALLAASARLHRRPAPRSPGGAPGPSSRRLRPSRRLARPPPRRRRGIGVAAGGGEGRGGERRGEGPPGPGRGAAGRGGARAWRRLQTPKPLVLRAGREAALQLGERWEGGTHPALKALFCAPPAPPQVEVEAQPRAQLSRAVPPTPIWGITGAHSTPGPADLLKNSRSECRRRGLRIIQWDRKRRWGKQEERKILHSPPPRRGN